MKWIDVSYKVKHREYSRKVSDKSQWEKKSETENICLYMVQNNFIENVI